MANENIPHKAIEALRNRGHDVKWIRTAAPGVSDKDVLTLAVNEERMEINLIRISGNWPCMQTFLQNAASFSYVSPYNLQEMLQKLFFLQ